MSICFYQSISLTTATDVPALTTGNDTITGAGGTSSADVLADPSSTDNDTLNVTFNAADLALNTNTGPTITASKIENVNVNFDALSGAVYNAASTTGATITGSSTKFGFNGAWIANSVAANNVKAGTGVTNLTVAGLTTGTVDLGSATTASVTTANATDSAALKVNGNVTSLTVATTTKTLTLNAAADAVVTFKAGAASNTATTITGVPAAGKVISLVGDEDVADGATVTGINQITLNADNAGDATTDATKWAASTKVVIAGDLAGQTLTHADGAKITVNTNQTTSLTLTGTSATTGTVDVTVGAGIGTLTALTLTGDKTAALKLSDTITISTLTTSGVGTTNLAIAGDTTISSLQAGTKAVVVTGTGNLTSTVASVAGSVDASAMAGVLTYTQTTNEATVVKGGTGNNTVIFAGTTNTSSYSDSGTAGNDTVTLKNTTGAADVTFAGGTNSVTSADVTSGSLAVTGGTGVDTVTVGATGNMDGATLITQLGEGNDIVSIAGVEAGAGTYTLDFGNGTDTLKLANNLDLSASTVTLTGLENISLLGAAAAATVSASTVSGKTYTIGGTAGSDTLTITGGDSAQTIDASTLNIGASLEKVVINGGNAADVIKGNGNNTIVGGTGADTITASVGGSDTIKLAGADTGGFTAPATNTINTTTFDKIAGLVAGDILHFTDYGAASGNTGTDDLLDSDAEASATTLVGATLAANATLAIRGNYTDSTNTFVGSATGTDTLLVYDANDLIATTTPVAVVLVGTGALTFGYAATDAAGIMTLA